MKSTTWKEQSVLVVDDDSFVRESLSELLVSEGYSVVEAENGKHALEVLKKIPHFPCLIVLDLRMPVLDGWGFLRLRAQDPILREIPVVVVSGSLVDEANFEGIDALLSKPLDFNALIRLIYKHSESRRTLPPASAWRNSEEALGNTPMRKKITNPNIVDDSPRSRHRWLDLQQMASVEVTSEDPSFPIETALISGEGSGWRAAKKGTQIIRIFFDQPTILRRIWLEFSEAEIERSHEFTLRWSDGTAVPFREIVRQQWNFSPNGSTSEIEDYQVQLENVSVLELTIKPGGNDSLATLSKCLLE
jgi:CheY-like chemotaxis protein